jgi:hypothetical protein
MVRQEEMTDADHTRTLRRLDGIRLQPYRRKVVKSGRRPL